MMRICPKCGTYYAADSLAFCRADGAPLVNVEPNSKNWSEGKRVVEEQTKTLRKQTRRVKLRRILTMSMSMTMITMVVSVVVLNTREYLKPNPDLVSQTNSNNKPDNNIVGNNNQDDKPGNDNQGNDNQRNDNQRNDNQRNDNQRNDNQAQDNPCSADKQKEATGSILKEINQQWLWNSKAEQQLALSRIPPSGSDYHGPHLGITNETRNVEPSGPGRGGRRGAGKVVGEVKIVASQTKGDRVSFVRAQPIKVTNTSSFSRQCTEATVTFAATWVVWRAEVAPLKKVPISLVTIFGCTKRREGWSCPKSQLKRVTS
jgi:hypothetical protein